MGGVGGKGRWKTTRTNIGAGAVEHDNLVSADYLEVYQGQNKSSLVNWFDVLTHKNTNVTLYNTLSFVVNGNARRDGGCHET